VLVIPSSVFAVMMVALVCLLCACYMYCRKTEAKRKIAYMMDEAQLDVDVEDLVNDESDEDDYMEEDDDEATVAKTVGSGSVSAYS
jgi:hypothetical protein